MSHSSRVLPRRVPSLARALLGVLLFAGVPVQEAAGGAPPLTIPLEIVEPAGREVVRDWPVTVGVVLPRNTLASLGDAHLTENGVEIPYDAEVTGYWAPDDTWIKWLLLRFKITTDRTYRWILEPGSAAPPGPPLASETSAEITIDSGALRAVIGKASPNLFEALELGGIPQFKAAARHSMVVVDDDPPAGSPAGPGAATFEQVSTVVEANTELRAAVKKSGIYRWQGQDIARLDLRYELFKDEAFVRLHHRVTWLERGEPAPHPICNDAVVDDVSMRAPDVAVTFPFADYSRGQEQTRFRVGFEPPVGAATFELLGTAQETVIQATAGAAVVKKAGGDYPNLAGWVELDLDAGARQAGLVVRDLWQTYPKLMTFGSDTLSLSLWSDDAGAAVGDADRGLAFAARDLLPQDAWWWWQQDYDASVPWQDRVSKWGGFRWVTDYFNCTGQPLPHHFVHEWNHISVYEHTGQGVARGHEMVLSLHDGNHGRPIEEIHSLVQDPVAVRQTPSSAMAVRFRGMKIPPVSQEPARADLERAVDQIGRFTLARWESLNDYGVWRYGKTRFHLPSVAFNRWYDNLQYDQQEIPMLLWMRGGDRRYLGEAHTLSRYAIDLNFNHHTTAAGARPGAGAGAAGLPIPWNRKHAKMETKLTFLALYYHLTGYRPALEILSTATRSLVDELEQDNGGCLAGGSVQDGPFDRGLYNTFGMLLTSYEERGVLDLRPSDPELIECWLGEVLAAIKRREYRDFFEAGNPSTPPLSAFRSPHLHLFENLVHFYDLASSTPLSALIDDSAGNLAQIMLDALSARGWPGLGQAETGLVPAPGFAVYAVALGWAFEQNLSQDLEAAAEIATLARDLARRIRDSIPDFPEAYVPGLYRSEVDERGIYPFEAYRAFSQLLMPMLVGTAVEAAAGDAGIGLQVDPAMADLFVNSHHPLRQLYVESRAATAIRLIVRLRNMSFASPYYLNPVDGSNNPKVAPVAIRVLRPDGGGGEVLVAEGAIVDAGLEIPPTPAGASAGEAARQREFWQPNPNLATALTFDGVAAGTIFRVELTDATGAPIHLIGGDGRALFVGAAAVHLDGALAVTERAGLVHDLVGSENNPSFAGAYSPTNPGGATFFTRVTTAHPTVYTTASTFTLRDAATWQWLDRMPMYRPEPDYPIFRRYTTDEDILDGGALASRLVAFTFSGSDSRLIDFVGEGYVRYVSATRSDWFDPRP